jgi:hypothetical protein
MRAWNGKNRTALLRLAELKMELCDVVDRYADLPMPTVGYMLLATGHELTCGFFIPQGFDMPIDDSPEHATARREAKEKEQDDNK